MDGTAQIAENDALRVENTRLREQLGLGEIPGLLAGGVLRLLINT